MLFIGSTTEFEFAVLGRREVGNLYENCCCRDRLCRSNSMLLAQHNEVIALDIVPEKVSLLNHRQSPIVDGDISAFFAA